MGNCCYAFSRTIYVGSEMIPFTGIEERAGDEEELDTTRQRQLTITVGLSAKLVS